MKTTTTEELMYQVMKAIYDSGIPVSFKGSMVLKACLAEAGFPEETRHTVDIDANWSSDSAPSAEQMTSSLQKALDNAGIGLQVRLYRMYGEGRSAGFELNDKSSGEILFTMDIDVNRPEIPTRIYETDEIRFRGAAPLQMIADKISVVSSDKVFRRIKDLVDLYYISKVFDVSRSEVLQVLQNSGRELGSFNALLSRVEELEYAYNKFRFTGDINKPPFSEVYAAVKFFLKELWP